MTNVDAAMELSEAVKLVTNVLDSIEIKYSVRIDPKDDHHIIVKTAKSDQHAAQVVLGKRIPHIYRIDVEAIPEPAPEQVSLNTVIHDGSEQDVGTVPIDVVAEVASKKPKK